MQIEISSSEVALRLLLTFIAGAIIGANRTEHGRPAGFRTTILVCLTASASMILGNLMLTTSGRAPDSFVTMDVMRLPLGILTGMGFIGAGAILHRGNVVSGVTTAATLWFTTLMGFCFGAGEVLLGSCLLGLGVTVLWCLEWFELRWKQRQEGTLVIVVRPEGPSEDEVADAVKASGHMVTSSAARYSDEENEWRLNVHWQASQKDTSPPKFVERLAARPGIKEVRWTPMLRT